jgi:ribosome-associated toxin RatA of RatAB toxin-antitoxin module
MAVRQIRLCASSIAVPAGEAFELLGDFGAYMKYSDAVKSVTVRTDDDGSTVSDWEVRFRRGRLRWTERDELDAQAGVIRFAFVRGDPEHFAGEWRVTTEQAGTQVELVAEFDLGIPTFADIIEPLAERTLAEVMESVLKGLFGADTAIAISFEPVASNQRLGA